MNSAGHSLLARMPPNLGRCEEDVVQLFFGEKGLDGGLINEVEFGVGAGKGVAERPLSPSPSPACGRGE